MRTITLEATCSCGLSMATKHLTTDNRPLEDILLQILKEYEHLRHYHSTQKHRLISLTITDTTPHPP